MKQYAAHQLDFYKTGHHEQYPEGTEYVYSNLTARSGKHSNIPNGKGVTFVGLHLFIQEYLIESWNETFFNLPKHEVLYQYKKRVSTALNKEISVEHLGKLHDLGYLPIHIKALPEGSFVPYQVPMLTITNTHPEFYWVTNMLETVMCAELWGMINTATTTKEYLRVLYKYAEITGSDKANVPYQLHDFSFRGMMGRDAAAKSGYAAIAAGIKSTDNVPALDIAQYYYNMEGFIAGSVPATEHSVMCAGDDELETYRRLITETYPSGIVSIVSDTWDFWNVVTSILPTLKEEILARDGTVVIRPDSGDPADIICGNAVVVDTMWRVLYDNIYYQGEHYEYKGRLKYIKNVEPKPEQRGLIECLWDTFGGTINEKGYKVLNPKIGAIYGDSITLAIQEDILARLEKKGFASSNIVFGIGSYSFQYTTRDTHSIAMKATSVTINGERKDIFKDPKTGQGKKSAKGLLMVSYVNGQYELTDQVSEKEENHGCLATKFLDGKSMFTSSFNKPDPRLQQFQCNPAIV